MLNNRKTAGFSILGLIIAGLVVAIIGLAGYGVYLNHNYFGWKSYQTKYEKLIFRYPNNWHLSSQSNWSNGAPEDWETITAPDGFYVELSILGIGHPNSNGPLPVEYAVPITFLGQKAYIDYYGTGFHANPKNPILGGAVSKSKTQIFAVFPSKNIRGGGWITIHINMSHEAEFYVNNVKYDANFKLAKLIIESMHY